MGISVEAWAPHAMSPAQVELLPARLLHELGEMWTFEVRVEHLADVGAQLNGPDTILHVYPRILCIWSPWRWRGFVSNAGIRLVVRHRAHAVARAFGLDELVFVPDPELGPEPWEFQDLPAMKAYLLRTWGPASDLENLDLAHVAAAEHGQVKTWYAERLAPPPAPSSATLPP